MANNLCIIFSNAPMDDILEIFEEMKKKIPSVKYGHFTIQCRKVEGRGETDIKYESSNRTFVLCSDDGLAYLTDRADTNPYEDFKIFRYKFTNFVELAGQTRSICVKIPTDLSVVEAKRVLVGRIELLKKKWGFYTEDFHPRITIQMKDRHGKGTHAGRGFINFPDPIKPEDIVATSLLLHDSDWTIDPDVETSEDLIYCRIVRPRPDKKEPSPKGSSSDWTVAHRRGLKKTDKEEVDV